MLAAKRFSVFPMKHLLPAAALLLLSSGVVPAQVEPPAKTAVAAPTDKGPVAAPAKAADAPTPATEAPKESLRSQKLKSLSFDRRPSATLKAWAGPAVGPELFVLAHPFLTFFDPLELEMAIYQRQVTLGMWSKVKAYLARLPKDEKKPAYLHLLQGLQQTPRSNVPVPPGPAQQYMERNFFSAEDVLGLASAVPCPLEKEHLNGLAAILGQAIQAGTVVDSVVARLRTETAKPAGKTIVTGRQAAILLTQAGHAAETEPFLPSHKEAEAQKDHEALNLLARHFVARHAKESKLLYLEKAWSATLAALAIQGGSKDERDEAFRRAVDLAARIRKELSEDWLSKSFTDRPERGMELLATLGSFTAQGLPTKPMMPDARLQELKLQKTAVEGLLKAAPRNADRWKNTLALLAANWLREAEYSQQFDRSTSYGQRMRWDPFGNIYFSNDPMSYNMMMPGQQNQPLAITTDKVLETRPGPGWLALLEEGPRARLSLISAELLLKIGEESQAFPYIEAIARAHPDEARKLSKEFLRVWTKNHDPNADRMQRSPYFWIFGFNRQAEGISLTRSQQERNLRDLSEWVKRLKKLPIGDPDEELLARAFTTSHSSAEVYRLEVIESVLGPLSSVKPRTLSGLLQQMRQNLASLWRRPDTQKKEKTNRQQKDIQREVLRGYALATAVTEAALKKFPEDWSLTLARAALRHDENHYQQELAKSTTFSEKRRQALAEFQRAAQLYGAAVKNLPQDDESIQMYSQWFYASLGATDLAQMDEDKLPDPKQVPLIKKAITSLPGETAERHLSRFVNDLITHLNSVKPALKYRYLRYGLDIAGDHKHAHEAKKTFNYYKDLVTEIKLDTRVDGSDVVGHSRPFGVFVNLRHTREIERESGGFGRYLQNQNSFGYYYNFGRPNADYRDRFQAAATEALKEHFDVLSVTFETEKVNSRATKEYGWRVTPYAYLLLKARSPRVDKLPPLRIDLDFMDTAGYVIIPVESPALAIDAAAKKPEPRPLAKLKVIQTLDERQADKGKLLLEIKASGLGLVGELEDILDFVPAEFDVAKKSDQGLSVAKFDENSPDAAVVSERTWMVTLQAKPDHVPHNFLFGKARGKDVEMTYQRYQDADLITATAAVDLEASYGRAGHAWLWWAAAGVLAGLCALGLILYFALRKPKARMVVRWHLPDRLTPFNVLTILNRIQQHNNLSAPEKRELVATIAHLEQHYFAGAENGPIDLRDVAESWVARAGEGR
jgi:hypothetical protein